MLKQAKTKKQNSSTHVLGFELIPGDIETNFKGILKALEISDISKIERLIPIFKINSTIGINTTQVDSTKRKSALLLLALAIRHKVNSFSLTTSDLAIIKAYFPADVIIDAKNNPNTRHTTVRQLLIGKNVSVMVTRR